MTGDERKRSLGVAAVLVLGTIAGFLVAAGTGGAEYATVDTIGSDSQAFQMPVEDEDQRVRFTLQADDGTATQPQASFALYDARDEFFAQFELQGDGDEAEAILDEAGPWVLFLTDRQNAQLAVQYEADDDEASEIDLDEMDVVEERTLVAEQDGGALSEEVVFRLDRRPATAFLEYSGDIQGLDAQIETDEGVVYGLTDASANTTTDGTQRDGDATLRSGNLAAGTYQVTANADAFDGRLVFVHQTYERAARDTPEAPENPVEEPSPVENGTVVAEFGDDEARLVDTAGAREVSFVTDPDAEAHLKIYNASDRLVERVQLEDDNHSWGWDGDENRSSPNHTAQTVELPEAGSYAVYASHVEDDERVKAVVPVENAPAAEELDVETQEETIEGSGSWNTTVPAALVEVHAQTRDLAGTERNVTVAGDLGPVLHYEQSFNTFGVALHQDYDVYPERFTDGEIAVTADGGGAAGATDVRLVHLVR